MVSIGYRIRLFGFGFFCRKRYDGSCRYGAKHMLMTKPQIYHCADTARNGHKAKHTAGYKTIFDITSIRIEKAADAIKDKKPDYDGDLGFRF